MPIASRVCLAVLAAAMCAVGIALVCNAIGTAVATFQEVASVIGALSWLLAGVALAAGSVAVALSARRGQLSHRLDDGTRRQAEWLVARPGCMVAFTAAIVCTFGAAAALYLRYR